MALSPKILYDKDKKLVQDALIKFYTERPNYYGFCDTRDEEYKLYADFISQYADKGKHLDFGTGTFRIAKELSKHNFEQVVGLDFFSEEDKSKLNSELKEIENASIVNYKESNKIPFDDNFFNSISSLCVFEHLVYPEKTLVEMDRVLKKDGFLIIDCPNWSGPNPAITGISYNLKGKRFWRYNNIFDSFFAIFRSFYWYFLNLLSEKGKFIMIYPRMKDNEIDFEFSDDDVVHLCQPISIIKFMKNMNYKLIYCNSKTGRTAYSKLFNKLFPMLATSNQIVLQKQ
jgi:ubiquinone/menaquinone biosynthesis C-methylase UbiE